MRARNITFGAKIKARWPPKRSELTIDCIKILCKIVCFKFLYSSFHDGSNILELVSFIVLRMKNF